MGKLVIAVIYNFSPGGKEKYYTHFTGMVDEVRDILYWKLVFNAKNSIINCPRKNSGIQPLKTRMRCTYINKKDNIFNIEDYINLSYNYFHRRTKRIKGKKLCQ